MPNQEELQLMKSEEELNEELRKLIALEKSSKPGSSNVTVFGGNVEGASHSDTSITSDINSTFTMQ